MRPVVVAVTSRLEKVEIDRLPTSTRRGFLTWWLGGLMAATVGAVVAPVAVYLWPPPASGSVKKRFTVSLPKALDALAEGEAARFDAPANGFFRMVDGGGANAAGDLTTGGYVTRYRGALRALGITCPHLGCYYNFDDGLKHFLCPCHGSQFALDGRVLHGPATSPLSHLSWAPGPAPDQILVDGLAEGG
jgi:Rieske Fe-S protein